MTTRSFIVRLRRRFRQIPLALPLTAGVAFCAVSVSAKTPVPLNLSGGLEKLVESNVTLSKATTTRSRVQTQTFLGADGQRYTSQQAAAFAGLTMKDAQGRLLVRVHFSGMSAYADARAAILAAAPSLVITAEDKKYKAGVLNAYVSLDEVPALAQAKGVGSVALETLPDVDRANIDPAKIAAPYATVGQTFPLVGTTFDAGVIQHRVDQINKFYNPSATLDLEGQNMQIGFISDSYAKSTNAITAAIDVTNFDLPGASNNPINTQPVVVLQDYTGTGTDEGRAMVQIGYRMAPKARLAFATANGGEVAFANNIRALGGLTGFTFPDATQQGFAADTICDDVTYADEPVYEDGIIAQGVEDVSAAGVGYFSSAGNNIGTNTYESTFRYVPAGTGLTAATNPALVGTNINLTGVPANLYAGGFHNFNPNGGLDVAQTWAAPASTTSRTSFQWDDPYNQTVTFNTPAIYNATGTSDGTTTTPSTFTTPSLTAGSNYVITVTATSGAFDAIVTIKDPNGNTVVNAQDTGTDETINFFPTVTGPYQIIVGIYGATTGNFAVNVYTGNNKKVTTDFNVLAFDTAGNYLPGSSMVADNIANNVPYDSVISVAATGQTQVQYVVARTAIPAATPTPASIFRIDIRGNGASGYGPVEYFTVNQANTKAHSTAPSCNSTAAMSVFRPSIPEYFTSPGPVVKYFDKVGNRLATPEIRLKPTIMAADQGNTSFFASDTTSDIDTKPNFGGTSAAAPHAAAIAALVIQNHGGRRGITPAQLTSILQRSAFPHDLDPNFATGVARVNTSTGSGKVTITVNSDRGLNPGSGAVNANSIQVSYVGAGSIATLVFNPGGTAATGGNTTGGNNGLDASNVYFDNVYPGLVFEPASFAYVVGSGSASLASTSATYGNLAGAPSNGTNQYYTMTLAFPGTAFTGGNVYNFSVGHAPQHDSTVSNGTGAANGLTATASTQADLFGGTILIPQGTGNGTGMTFSGTMTDGTQFNGTFTNRIGAGYSVTEGFGMINAQTAVSQTVQ